MARYRKNKIEKAQETKFNNLMRKFESGKKKIQQEEIEKQGKQERDKLLGQEKIGISRILAEKEKLQSKEEQRIKMIAAEKIGRNLEKEVCQELERLKLSNALTESKPDVVLDEMISKLKENIEKYNELTQPTHTTLQIFLGDCDFEKATYLVNCIKKTKNSELLENYINLVCSCQVENTALHFAARGSKGSEELYTKFKQLCIDVLGSEEKLTSLNSVNNEGFNPDSYFNKFCFTSLKPKR